MKLSIDKQNRPWIYALVAMSLIFLLVGLGVGVGASHSGLFLHPLGKAAADEPKPAFTAHIRNLSDFRKNMESAA